MQTERSRRTWRISASVSRATRELVERAANREGVSIAAFVRRVAIERAEAVMEGRDDE